jgi:hypothetical protein
MEAGHERPFREESQDCRRRRVVGHPDRVCAAPRYLGRLPRHHVRPAWLVAYDVEARRCQLGLRANGVTVFMGVFKLFMWFLFLVALWLTLWARQLRKLDRQGAK